MEGLAALVAPHSIAVIGASDKKGSLGCTTMQNIINSGVPVIYPINARADSILGHRAYSSIAEVPGEIDLAVICIAAPACPQAVRDCIAKGVKAASMFAAGFEEMGAEGARLQQEIVDAVSGSSLRVLGPNCTGVYNSLLGYNLTLSPTFENIREKIKPGRMSFISQSGSYGIGLFIWAVEQGMHFSKFFSVGNKVDVDETAILEYLGDDNDTTVVLLYLEDIKQGRRFMEVARKVTTRKPVVALKIGRTASGARASASHTGAVVGSFQVYQAAFKQTGVIQVASSRELLDTAKALAMQPPAKGRRIGLVTNSGAQGAEMADILDENGMVIPELSAATQQRLVDEGAVPKYGITRNPVDLGAPVPQYPDWYYHSTRILLESGEVDGVILIMIGTALEWSASKFVAGAEELRRHGKPVIISGLTRLEGMNQVLNPLQQEAGIPVYEDCRAVGRSMAALCDYGLYLKGEE